MFSEGLQSGDKLDGADEADALVEAHVLVDRLKKTRCSKTNFITPLFRNVYNSINCCKFVRYAFMVIGCFHYFQSFGAGAARSRPFWLEPEPKKLRSFGSGSIIKEDV